MNKLMLSRCTVFLILVGFVFFGCSNPPPEAASKPPVAAPGPPPDESQHFPQTGLVKMERIPINLLGKTFMPGGNLATYKRGKLTYQQFLGKMQDPDHAAFLLLDWNKTLKPSTYLAYMGGYFGMDDAQPVYVFTKGAWIAGVVGLPKDKADPIAREFAARL
jgi:hypothetical protein